MGKRLGAVAVCFMVVGFSLSARATDNPYYRYTNSFTKAINQDWSISLYTEFDTYNFNETHAPTNSHDLHAINPELTANYAGAAPWVDLGAGIGYWDSKSNGSWEDSTYPIVYATFKKTMFGLEFSDRNRLDAEIPEHYKGEGPVYRNAFTIATEKKWTSLELQPFVSNEIFYNFRAKYMSDNQAFVGFNFKITKDIHSSLSFMMDSSHMREADGDHWKKTPIVILSTSVNF
jgi:Protein of unknown function (DUF2490)